MSTEEGPMNKSHRIVFICSACGHKVENLFAEPIKEPGHLKVTCPECGHDTFRIERVAQTAEPNE